MGPMSQFRDELRGGIGHAQQAVVKAERAGLPHEAYLHRARLQDLLEMAVRHGVDTDDWVVPSIRRGVSEDLARAGD